MALIVENGTGLTNADAFTSAAWVKAYWDARGRDYSSYSETQIDQSIVRATDYLSESFSWQGSRLKERGAAGGAQSLAWPRTFVQDRNGYAIPNNEVPVEVQKATAEVAWLELGTPGAMAAVYNPAARTKSKQVGSIRVEYYIGSEGAQAARPVVLMVQDLIGDLLSATGNNLLSGEAYR